MVKIKLCGLQSEEDILMANAYALDYIGFVFAPSKRQVTLQQAKMLARKVATSKIVGVFVNEALPTILQIAKEVPLDILQLHGEESDCDIQMLQANCSCEIWKALRLSSLQDDKRNCFPHADRFLIDSYVADHYGGNGKRIAMELLQQIAVQELMLAGGINAQNIKEILPLCPYGIDVSSSIETKGKKDRKKLQRFMEAVQGE